MSLVLPEAVRRAIGGAELVGDDTGRSGMRVFRAGNAFLKIGPASSLERAARMQEFFAAKGLSAPLLVYERTDEEDYLLAGAVPGVSCIDKGLLAKPEWLSAKLGETARMLHETEASGCPYRDCNEREAGALRRETGRELPEARLLRAEVLVQGDFCLPNVFFRGGAFSGFIDLGEAGVGDSHLDLYWALWSLEYNLRSDRWNDRFLDAYGRDKVDGERLAACRAMHQ